MIQAEGHTGENLFSRDWTSNVRSYIERANKFAPTFLIEFGETID